jgi:hypothetical protein
MFVLPVSGDPVALRVPSGRDDMLLAETHGSEARVRVGVVRQLAPLARVGAQWDSLPFVDVDAALLALRQFLAGDRLVAEIQCTHCTSCGDMELSIAEYLTAKRPRLGKGSSPAWIPTVEQVLAAIDEHGPGESAARAIEAASLRGCSGKEARSARAELEKAAPLLAGSIAGECPNCGADMEGWFDPGAFVITEMRERTAMLLEEVHLLASRYGWHEKTILALPASRRTAYAELIFEERRAR